MESGYSVKVQKYDLKELLKGSPAQSFTDKLEVAMKSKNWYRHQIDLLRYLVLYKWGGVYIDLNVIILHPMDSLKMNTLGWVDQHHKNLSSAFMMFEKDSFFLKSCLEEFAKHYKIESWESNGPLLTRV